MTAPLHHTVTLCVRQVDETKEAEDYQSLLELVERFRVGLPDSMELQYINFNTKRGHSPEAPLKEKL